MFSVESIREHSEGKLHLNTDVQTRQLKQNIAQSLHWWQRRKSEIEAVEKGVTLLNERGYRNAWISYVLSEKFDFGDYTKCVISNIGSGTYETNLNLLGLGRVPGDEKTYGFFPPKTYVLPFLGKAACKRMHYLWRAAARYERYALP